MFKLFDSWDQPADKEIYMIAGWRQWADGGAISSGLPLYMVKKTQARKIGEIKPDGFYLFQLPGTQDLMRPLVRHVDGYTESLQSRKNEFYYSDMGDKGLVIFRGDEPHMNVERYVESFLDAAKTLGVKRIMIFGGIYGEVPYDKDRFVSSIYSVKSLREEVASLVVNLSGYQGGASIGSYVCKRAGEQGIELVGLYTFSPIFQFVSLEKMAESIHIEKDYKAWLDVMRRVNYFFGLDLDLSGLERKSLRLLERIENRLHELDQNNPELGIKDYVSKLSDEFQEDSFTPLEDIWQDELRRLGDKFESSGDE